MNISFESLSRAVLIRSQIASSERKTLRRPRSDFQNLNSAAEALAIEICVKQNLGIDRVHR